MYQSPKLLRYGSFRDLTKSGQSGAMDQLLFLSIDNSGGGGGDPGITTLEVGGSR